VWRGDAHRAVQLGDEPSEEQATCHRGTPDLQCLVCEEAIDQVVQELVGARGKMNSVYIRDQDKNLIELACCALP
jgi:hypothetical protein